MEIERLAGALADADEASFPPLARQLRQALCTAPPQVSSALGDPCDSSRFNALLAAGATREAAFELLGRAQYMLSRSQHQHVIASVAADELFSETTLGGEHESTACAGALALGLRNWARAVRHFPSAAAR